MDLIPPGWRTKLYRLISWATPFLALVLIGLVYFLGVRTERTGFVREVLDPGLKRITNPVLNAFRGGVPPVHSLLIQLDSAAVDSMLEIEHSAKVRGWLGTSMNAYFVGSVEWGDSTLAAVISLQEGPRINDGKADLGQLQVGLVMGDTIQGMQRFNLKKITNGQVLHGWLMAHVLAEQRLPVLGRSIVEATTPWYKNGLSSLEGALDSTALVRWGAENFIAGWYGNELYLAAQQETAELKYPVDPLRQADWLVAPILTSLIAGTTKNAQTTKAQELVVRSLDAFRKGSRSTSEVFQVNALAKLYALSDLFGQQRTMAWWNLRFVPDSTARLMTVPLQYLEPGPIARIHALTSGNVIRFPSNGSDLIDRMFNDPIFYRAYVAYLDTISTPGWSEALFERYAAELDLQERIVVGYFPQYVLDRAIFEHNRLVIRSTLYPKDLMLAYFEDRIGAVDRLAVGNVHALPVEVVAFVAENDTVELEKPIFIAAREPDMPLTYDMIRLEVSSATSSPSVLLVRPVGLHSTIAVHVGSWNTFSSNPAE